ncbi:DUF1109 domain-containing protein [Tardiphaga sp. vice352]|uniref:NrsF family protein n=1 Tax=unclassified Tardiphaga TaxID=2631404 RepID=UPI0011654FE4|nr:MULTISPECIES: DUF1109 domain-containing protein [unclassified Tardiphaga]QDM16501.1 DUF1109 domain-containing protein [Tardiphaga sp. vice278]QDM21525.1 DUF1109 domain-containing protein [Tardiphaga sp. vice154]QDM26711.1 DUF1109 domain-containing protein [Tardiphaga sp. vice304]QDM31775.1 DUF1109 domain-containing protein [Tardiphaga sp. vice352]
MDTERLIRTLAADAAPRRPVGLWLTAALLLALPVAALIMLSSIGLRPDIRSAMRTPLFDLKFVVTLALAIPALAISLHLSRPEATLRGRGWWLLAPLVILALGAAAEMAMPDRLPMGARWMGHNAMLCLSVIPLLALPILAAALLALRQGAPSRPALAGAVAGLLSAGLAATLYAAHCIDDSPLFVATWYTLATALVAAIGALAGARWLKY